MSDERYPWDRRPGETNAAYEAFRRYREAGPMRTLAAARGDHADKTVAHWSARWDWGARAAAWDDEVHMIEDRARLDAIRVMHGNHQRAGRAVMTKALAALNKLDPEDIPAYAAARLLELGARLERDTLTVSVAELQGIAWSAPAAEDPWEAIARELTGSDPD